MIAALFITMFILVLFGVPVSFAVAISTILAILTGAPEVPLTLVVQRVFGGMNSFPLMCIPFFVLTGNLMGAGNVSQKLIDLANIFVGRIRGGLAHVNILTSMFFGGVSGSSSADVSSIGAILIPTMNKAGYTKEFSVAVTAASSTIGIIIPPSNPMIIYAMVAGSVSISGLFLAGIFPGILVGISFMIVSYIISLKRGYKAEVSRSKEEVIKAFLSGIVPMFTFVIIIGGILSGIFTPTESAVIAALYSYILVTFVYKTVKIKDLPGIFLSSGLTTAVVLFLIGVSSIFGWLIAYSKVPQLILEYMFMISTEKGILLFLILLLLLIIGTFMDTTAALIIFVPILLPVVQQLGVDSIHFGLIMVTALAVGGYTPPVGVVLYLACNIGDVSLEKGSIAVIPFILAAIVVCLIVIYIPEVSMFLPNLLN